MKDGPSGQSLSRSRRPIGVFDSGLGGLTVVREIRRGLPSEFVVYFGDTARLPYGTKSREQILRFSIQNTLFLLRHNIKALVIACNSSASAATSFLKAHFNLPILDVIQPSIEAAAEATRSGRMGVIATQATIDSGVYEKALRKINPRIRIFTAACPLFVPLVEEGWVRGEIPTRVAESYLAPLVKKKIDVLMLGCTHYPLLKQTIQQVAGKGVRLIDSALPTVKKLTFLLQKKGLSYPKRCASELKIYVSDRPRNFARMGESFLGERLNHVELVRQK